MDVELGACAVVLACLCIILGMAEVGLWVACYFECQDGAVVEFNYFAAIWTGILAFAIGFMILVLICVKFKVLGTLIAALTFLLVPCEILCACLYAYRAYLASADSATTGSTATKYFSVIMFSTMAFCGVFLFVVTIYWNCYYFCLATPLEDFEEEVKEDLEEEEARQRDIRSAADRFINNPIVEDDYRTDVPSARPFTQAQPTRRTENGHVRFPNNSIQRRGEAVSTVDTRNHRHLDSRYTPASGNERNPQAPHIRNDYPYPPAFSREVPPPQQKRRTAKEIMMMPRLNRGQNQSHRSNEHGQGMGQVNRGYQPDESSRPAESSYNVRSYVYDGIQGRSFDRQEHVDPPPAYNGHSRGIPNRSGLNPSTTGQYSRKNLDESRRHVNRPNRGAYGDSGVLPVGFPNSTDKEEPTSAIYRPRPENFRGKPPKPAYMQHQEFQQPLQSGQSNVAPYRDTSQYSAFQATASANSYF